MMAMCKRPFVPTRRGYEFPRVTMAEKAAAKFEQSPLDEESTFLGAAAGYDRAYERELEIDRFRSLRATGDSFTRDLIVADSQGLAISLARRFRDRGAELDDLIQVAQIGLLLAIERFDPERGVPFVGFATPTILGELRRHFRTVWSVRMPRSLQEATQRVNPAISELHQELGRTPTVDEVAKRVGFSAERVLEAMEAGGAFRSLSLDAPIGGEESSYVGLHASLSSADSERAFDSVVAQQAVERLLPLLSPRSQQIVKLRFYEERSQSEIAEIVGISQMHVSRLLQQAFEQFSKHLSSDQDQ
jgi:RNA polymerase sigma-B factor